MQYTCIITLKCVLIFRWPYWPVLVIKDFNYFVVDIRKTEVFLLFMGYDVKYSRCLVKKTQFHFVKTVYTYL